MRSGVRCAETTPTSNGTSNSASAWAAASITGQSLSLPMINPTRGSARSSEAMAIPSIGPLRVRQPVCRSLGPLAHVRDVLRVVGRPVARPDDVDVPDLAARAFCLAVQMDMGIRHPAEQMVQPLVHRHR